MPSAPRAVIVMVDGQPTEMTVALGSPTRAMYRVIQPIGNACRSYHFVLATADGLIWRYPGRGELRTTGESCSEEWTP